MASPLLPVYWVRQRAAEPTTQIRCPPRLRQEALLNGLDVVDVLTDGNCGPDAFGKSMMAATAPGSHLHASAAFKRFLTRTADVYIMVAYLRDLVCAWMRVRANADSLIWEGVRFKDIALMMSPHEETYDAYVERMSRDREWFDAASMHVLGCVFNVDAQIWQSGMDPAIVGPSCTANPREPLAMIPICMVNDTHYWALCPHVDTLVPYADHGDFLPVPPRSADAPSSTPKRQTRAGENGDNSDDSSDGDRARQYASIHGHPHRLPEAVVQHELDLCIGLGSWDPWAPPTQELVDAIHRLAANTADNGVERPLIKTCLQRQQVIADLTYEQEHSDSLPDRMKYHASARWRLQADYCSHTSLKSKKRLPKPLLMEYDQTHQALDIRGIREKLMMPCWRNSTPHTCLDVFKDQPNVVRNWRVLWHSLPASKRRETLIALMNDKKRRSRTGAQDTRLPFLGVGVCRTAWRMLTGIGNWSLQCADRRAEQGNKSSLSCRELGMAKMIKSTNKQKLYLDARKWLIHYACTFGDHSPIDCQTFLPQGRKRNYYALYVADRAKADQEYSSPNVFLEAWRFELPWLLIATSLCKFVKCGVCEYLRGLIDQTSRADKLLLNALVRRLGAHWSFQSAQRLVQDNLQEACNQSNGKNGLRKSTKWIRALPC